MSGRIGQYFLFIGLITLIIYFASEQAQTPDYRFFCSGLVLFLFGAVIWWRAHEPAKDTGRFRILRQRKEKDKK